MDPYPKDKPLKQVNVKYSGDYPPKYKPPQEDTAEEKRKRMEAKMVEEEKEKNRITTKEAVKKLLKRKLELNSLKKAAGRSLETLDNIMENFYREKIRKLIQICRTDQKKLNDLLSSYNVGKPGLVTVNEGGESEQSRSYLHLQKYVFQNKLVDRKNNEQVVPYSELEVLYTNDTRGLLTQIDEERIKVIKEKLEYKKVSFRINFSKFKHEIYRITLISMR